MGLPEDIIYKNIKDLLPEVVAGMILQIVSGESLVIDALERKAHKLLENESYEDARRRFKWNEGAR